MGHGATFRFLPGRKSFANSVDHVAVIGWLFPSYLANRSVMQIGNINRCYSLIIAGPGPAQSQSISRRDPGLGMVKPSTPSLIPTVLLAEDDGPSDPPSSLAAGFFCPNVFA